MRKKPKSAYDLAMEKLDAADREAGVKETPLSDLQKKSIAEARRAAAARLAEYEVFFRDHMRTAADPDERAKIEEEYLADRKRIENALDRSIESIRSGRR